MADRTLTAETMTAVPINEFITGNTLPVDVYVRIGENKFICVGKAGAQTERDRLGSYQNKKVDELWIHKDDHTKLAKIQVAIAGVVVNRSDLSGGQKTTVVSLAAKSVFDEIGGMGISAEMFEETRKITDQTVKLAEHQSDLAKLMESLNNCSDALMRHSMAVSIFCVMIGKAIGWQKDETLEKLSLGGMLHDIGKKALPPEVFTKPKSELTYEEIQLYESHPYRGMEMLKQLSVVSPDVVAMVFQHHENSLAQGFPQKLRDYRINPFARVCALANEFANLTIKNPAHLLPKSPAEAVDYIEKTMGQPFNKEIFKAWQATIVFGQIDQKKPA